MLTITIPGVPVPQPRPRISTRGGFGRAYVASGHPIHAYRLSVAEKTKRASQAKRWPLAMGPVAVTIRATFPRRPAHVLKSGRLAKGAPAFPPAVDVDNLAKGILDAITGTGLVWKDDAQVVELHVVKNFAGIGKPGETAVEIALFQGGDDGEGVPVGLGGRGRVRDGRTRSHAVGDRRAGRRAAASAV